jgi:hypothetical protein
VQALIHSGVNADSLDRYGKPVPDHVSIADVARLLAAAIDCCRSRLGTWRHPRCAAAPQSKTSDARRINPLQLKDSSFSTPSKNKFRVVKGYRGCLEDRVR